MGRRVRRVEFRLDAKGVKGLSEDELRAILRGADPLVGLGGRSLLVKVLKGSRNKKVLELGLDRCPVYGYYKELSPEEILARIDWAILNEYLEIEYRYRLPVLIFSKKGWEIEKDTYATELLRGFDEKLASGAQQFDMSYLKDRNRELILLLLDKVEATADPKYIPLLKAWERIDYKKVRQRIRQVIRRLTGCTSNL